MNSIRTRILHDLYYLPLCRRLIRRWAMRFEEGKVVTIPCGAARGRLWRVNHGFVSAYWLGVYELGVQRVLASILWPGAIFYDVGANAGFFSVCAAQSVGTQGTVFAFEPESRCVTVLLDLMSINGIANVRVVDSAVSDECGVGWLLNGRDRSTSRLSTGAVDQGPAVRTSVTTLDEFAGTHAAPDVVKMDIEGGEVKALQGASGLLHSAHPPTWLIEVHSKACRDAVERILLVAGYRMWCVAESRLVTRRGNHLLAVAQPNGSL